VWSTARAGAVTAGIDGVGGLWFNPAGLAGVAADPDRRTEILVDVGYVKQNVTYDRIDSGNNRLDTVENGAPGTPIPTLGAAYAIGHGVVLSVGVMAPYASVGDYPDDGAQRYSMVSLADTAFAFVEAAVAWQATPTLRVGAAFQNVVMHLRQSVITSGCPGQTVCPPEDSDFDSLVRLGLDSYFNPTGVLGAQLDLGDRVRAGVAVQLPVKISGTGTLDVRLPSSGFFNGASVAGNQADVAFHLPAAVRAGVQVEPVDRWKVELDVDVELWSVHDQISIDPDNMRIEDTPGVGTYQIGPMTVPRRFDNSVAVKLGLEAQPAAATPLSFALGYAYETAATPDEYLSIMTVDGNKHMITGGLAYALGATRVFVSAAYVAVGDRTVSPEVGVAPQLTPIRPPDDAEPLDVYVNWGAYSSSWLMLGAGVSARF
jgi:long-subunit fatty acid transport protein